MCTAHAAPDERREIRDFARGVSVQAEIRDIEGRAPVCATSRGTGRNGDSACDFACASAALAV
eukprot:CAMPEP_0176283740 /NCGR_PEP_ID=MMETSP0121_2-20121125/51476_1 /TAXON_ID=160619 /ORGANISM="Kryptoperidinium foliaceum, Strain CCMP 1326" /LENGTH=62 /DNA_ID=CAMNT_0017624135 /DNA_START=79 /DNA_END=267 /DNA_ORIENTATION=-